MNRIRRHPWMDDYRAPDPHRENLIRWRKLVRRAIPGLGRFHGGYDLGVATIAPFAVDLSGFVRLRFPREGSERLDLGRGITVTVGYGELTCLVSELPAMARWLADGLPEPCPLPLVHDPRWGAEYLWTAEADRVYLSELRHGEAVAAEQAAQRERRRRERAERQRGALLARDEHCDAGGDEHPGEEPTPATSGLGA